MAKYILKRIIAGILTTFVLITATFFLMHAIPGGPFSPTDEKNVPVEVLERLNEKFGLDRPVWEQYLLYLKNLLRGDFGISYKQLDVTVNEMISRGFPVSAKVGIVAVLVSLVVGVGLGITSAIRRHSWADWASMVFATVGISVPVFVISVLLLYLFSVWLKWLPTFGLTSWRH